MYEFPTTSPVNVQLRLGGGSAEVVAEARTTATVEVAAYDDSDTSREAAEQTRVEFRNDHLSVTAPEASGWIFRRSARIRVVVRVPQDSSLQVKVASTDVTCQGRFAQANVTTASGDLVLHHATGDVTVNTASGDVRLGEVGGRLTLNAASAELAVQLVHGDIAVHAASGDVEIERAQAGVRATTASGDIRVGAVNRGEVNIKSASGDVSIGVAAGTGVWLDLTTMSGSTRSDLPVNQASPPSDAGTADLNVAIRTMSGDISIRRANLPAAA